MTRILYIVSRFLMTLVNSRKVLVDQLLTKLTVSDVLANSYLLVEVYLGVS